MNVDLVMLTVYHQWCRRVSRSNLNKNLREVAIFADKFPCTFSQTIAGSEVVWVFILLESLKFRTAVFLTLPPYLGFHDKIHTSLCDKLIFLYEHRSLDKRILDKITQDEIIYFNSNSSSSFEQLAVMYLSQSVFWVIEVDDSIIVNSIP